MWGKGISAQGTGTESVTSSSSCLRRPYPYIRCHIILSTTASGVQPIFQRLALGQRCSNARNCRSATINTAPRQITHAKQKAVARAVSISEPQATRGPAPRRDSGCRWHKTAGPISAQRGDLQRKWLALTVKIKGRALAAGDGKRKSPSRRWSGLPRSKHADSRNRDRRPGQQNRRTETRIRVSSDHASAARACSNSVRATRHQKKAGRERQQVTTDLV